MELAFGFTSPFVDLVRARFNQITDEPKIRKLPALQAAKLRLFKLFIPRFLQTW
jgi:hypothetical protein